MAFALKEYLPLLAEAVRAAGITWKKDPSQWLRYRITFANDQQRWVLRERCRLKLRDAKKRDEAEALGAVIRAPDATAAIHENPDPDVQMPASGSQDGYFRGRGVGGGRRPRGSVDGSGPWRGERTSWNFAGGGESNCLSDERKGRGGLRPARAERRKSSNGGCDFDGSAFAPILTCHNC
jgi:hypothetical protein